MEAPLGCKILEAALRRAGVRENGAYKVPVAPRFDHVGIRYFERVLAEAEAAQRRPRLKNAVDERDGLILGVKILDLLLDLLKLGRFLFFCHHVPRILLFPFNFTTAFTNCKSNIMLTSRFKNWGEDGGGGIRYGTVAVPLSISNAPI